MGFLHLLLVADKNRFHSPFVYLRKFLLGVCTLSFVLGANQSEEEFYTTHSFQYVLFWSIFNYLCVFLLFQAFEDLSKLMEKVMYPLYPALNVNLQNVN